MDSPRPGKWEITLPPAFLYARSAPWIANRYGSWTDIWTIYLNDSLPIFLSPRTSYKPITLFKWSGPSASFRIFQFLCSHGTSESKAIRFPLRAVTPILTDNDLGLLIILYNCSRTRFTTSWVEQQVRHFALRRYVFRKGNTTRSRLNTVYIWDVMLSIRLPGEDPEPSSSRSYNRAVARWIFVKSGGCALKQSEGALQAQLAAHLLPLVCA